MAKTKQDYTAIGYSEFLHNLPVPNGSSWQEKAKAQGWINAQKAEHEWNTAKWADEENQKKSIIHPALMHIQFLLKQCNYLPTTNRTDRYRTKIEKLERKWAKRGIMF